MSINELSKLMAKHILEDNMLDIETVARKAKIYLLAWQRTQQIPKKIEKLTQIQIDGIKYQIMKKHYENVILENIDPIKAGYEINRLREIMDLIDKQNFNPGTGATEQQ
jgi:hypothetical protein